MKTRIWPHVVCSRLAATALLLGAALLCHPGTASAEDCGGPLSTSTGNIAGSVLGAVGGGLLGSQFGGGAGKGVITGLGVVGGALAGGYAGRQVEGCPSHRQAARQAAGAGGGARTCRYVNNPATIDGQAQQVEGVACLEQDGSWKIATGPAAERAASADLVLRAQQRLHDQGFYVRNNVDGRWGPATSAAVGNFQRTNGMAPSGQLDAPTRTALGLDPIALTDLAQGGQPAQDNQPAQGGQPVQAAQPPATTPVATTPGTNEPGSYYK
jgi:surface antigen